MAAIDCRAYRAMRNLFCNYAGWMKKSKYPPRIHRIDTDKALMLDRVDHMWRANIIRSDSKRIADSLEPVVQ